MFQSKVYKNCWNRFEEEKNKNHENACNQYKKNFLYKMSLMKKKKRKTPLCTQSI